MFDQGKNNRRHDSKSKKVKRKFQHERRRGDKDADEWNGGQRESLSQSFCEFANSRCSNEAAARLASSPHV